MRVLVFLLLLACTGRAFDTVYSPGQHSAIISIQCDDTADTSFVNVAVEHGVTIDFAPYPYGGVIDIDSNFVKGEAYKEFALRYAKDRGMTFSMHDQPQAPTIAGTYGRDSLITRWNNEKAWLRGVVGGSGDRGFVWVGHVTNPETRAMAREYGMKFTRGGITYSPDLYLAHVGRQTGTGAFGFPPLSMLHKILVPSCSMYRLTGYDSADSLKHASTAADSTYLFRGTVNFLNTLAANNAYAVWNIHPGWTGVHQETQADTIAANTWVRVERYGAAVDSIQFSKRRGNTSRNDVSSYQLDYILKAAQWWSDSTLAVDGVSRLCIANIQELMDSPSANMREDNSLDPDSVADTFTGGDETYWVSRDGLFAKDPALDRSRQYYVDGSGTVKAGNGTAAYPLPRTAWNDLFNCVATFVNVDGDTLNLVNPITGFGGEVDIDFGGLIVTRTTDNANAFTFKPTSNSYYNKGVTWRNLTVDLDAGTTGYAFQFGGATSALHDSLRTSDATIKGVTIKNGKFGIIASNVSNLVVDSCFVTPGAGAFSDVSGTILYSSGTINYNTLLRNSVWDLSDCGTSSMVMDFATTLPPDDSLRFVNNVVKLGNALDTDDLHWLIRTNNDSTANGAKKIRIAGTYIANSRVGALGPDIWASNQRGQNYDLAELTTYLAPGGMGVSKSYIATGWAFAYNHITNASDTTRFGGYTGTGSRETGLTASIGPSVFGYYPLVWTSGAVQGRAAAATLQGPWEVLSLVNNGVLTTSNETDTDTWFEIPRIYDESSLAVARSFLDAWEKWPAASQAKVRFKVSGEPVATIRSADSTYQTLGQLVNALAGNVAAETASDSLDASTWFSLPRPYNLSAAFQIEIARAWWRVLPDSSKVRIRFRVAGTDYSLASPDSSYANGLWAASKAIGAAAETASDSLDAATWFMLPRVYDMAQAQQAGVYRDAWAGWPLARQQEVRMRTK